MRSTTGLSAVLRKSTARVSAPVFSNSCWKYLASSKVTPIAAKTTANFPSSSVPRSAPLVSTSFFESTRACLAICAASLLWGRPAPEKSGSFCPRTSVLSTSIVEIPVWMKSSGYSREAGLMGLPLMSTRFSGRTAGPPSMGLPAPLKTRPSMSSDTPNWKVRPRKRTLVPSTLRPCVDSKSWTTARPLRDSRTFPRRVSPVLSFTSQISS